MTGPCEATGERERLGHLTRLADLAERKAQQALQVRNADNTAQGERIAERAELDAAAVRWALVRLDPERSCLEEFFAALHQASASARPP